MIRSEDYEFLVRLLKDVAGMDLGADKAYLIRSRLEPLALRLGLKDLPALFDKLRLKDDSSLQETVVEAMLTNESLFFRDAAVFDKLKGTVFPDILAQRKVIRIWSAACSTGQEPYSIAMMLASSPWEAQGWTFEIMATDLSHTALSRATQGVYSELEVQRGLNPELLARYFDRVSEKWKVKPEIARRVSFHCVNLTRLDARFGQFDLIFCRNMLIYCDTAVKKKVIGQLTDFLRPDGYLVLGASENLMGVSDAFDRPRGMDAPIYRKKR